MGYRPRLEEAVEPDADASARRVQNTALEVEIIRMLRQMLEANQAPGCNNAGYAGERQAAGSVCFVVNQLLIVKNQGSSGTEVGVAAVVLTASMRVFTLSGASA